MSFDPLAITQEHAGTFPRVIAQARPSIVGVTSAVGSGSGYVALANGVTVTSQSIVGYESHASLFIEGGTEIRARVIRVNVALDVALLLPETPIDFPPLRAFAGEPEVAEAVLALGRAGTELLATPTSVASIERRFDDISFFQLNASFDAKLIGAPLLNANGMVLGCMVKPRARSESGALLRNLALPLASFEGGLSSVDVPATRLTDVTPEYGCPHCDTVFEPTADRCLECGTQLPHPFRDLVPHPPTAPDAAAVFAVQVALASVALSEARARTSLDVWRIPGAEGEADVWLSIDRRGALVLRAPLRKSAPEGFEAFYRHLLFLNDGSAGTMRIGIGVDGAALLEEAIPLWAVSRDTFPIRLRAFAARHALAVRHLARTFDASGS